MVGLIGVKVGMTHLFDDIGVLVPITVVDCSSNLVVGKRVADVHGYDALVLGALDSKKSLSRPLAGQFSNEMKPKRVLREFKNWCSDLKIGDPVGVDVFKDARYVDVTGVSKGKGFAGGMKRHGFHGGPATHGSKFHRALGSTGQISTPNTKPGRKMAGRMGSCRVTVQNLEIVQIRPDLGLIILKGAVPGVSKGIVFVKAAVKMEKG